MFKKQSVDIGGTTDPGFENVKKVFEENFVNGNEISAQLCIVKNGKIVSTISKFLAPKGALETLMSSVRQSVSQSVSHSALCSKAL